MEIENKVGAIEINIRNARLRSLVIHLKDGESPNISAFVELMTASGKKITEVTLSTDAWNDNQKIRTDELPAELFEAIGVMVRLMSPVCTRKINAIDGLLEA